MIEKLRSLTSDTLVYGMSTILGRFLTFLLTPIYTNYLSKAELGETAYLYSLIAFVNILYGFGLDSAFFKFYDKDNRSTTERVFSVAFVMILAVSGAITLLITATSTTCAQALDVWSRKAGMGDVVAIAGWIAFYDALTVIPYAALRMARKARRFAMTKFAVIVINVIANLVLVVGMKQGIMGVFVAGMISSIAGVLLVAPEIAQYLRTEFDKPLLRDMLTFGLPTIPAGFAAMMLQVIDRPIMQLVAGADEVGLYQANFRLALPMMMMVTMFEYAWKPFFLSHSSPQEARTLFPRVMTYFTVVCSVVFLATSLLMEYVVTMPFIGGRFINPAYWSGLGIIPIVLFAYFFLGLYTNLTAGIYIRKRTAYLPIATGTAAGVKVLFNLALVPLIGMWGAAWATVVAYGVSAFMLCRLSLKIFPLQYEWRRIFALVLITALVFVAATMLTKNMSVLVAIALRSACVLVPVMIFSLFFLQPDERVLFQRLWKKIQR
jgi:O-antigen/teichoic acid export membrane protein